MLSTPLWCYRIFTSDPTIGLPLRRIPISSARPEPPESAIYLESNFSYSGRNTRFAESSPRLLNRDTNTQGTIPSKNLARSRPHKESYGASDSRCDSAQASRFGRG